MKNLVFELIVSFFIKIFNEFGSDTLDKAVNKWPCANKGESI